MRRTLGSGASCASWARRSLERAGISYGWCIVLVAFLCFCVNTGIFFYSFGVFFVPLVEHEGWSRAALGGAYSLAQIMSAVYAPFLGRLVDRRGPKLVQVFGACVLALGLFVLGRVHSVWQFDLTMGVLLALGSASLGGVSSSAAVASWFEEGRGRALGIATAGISMGGVVFVPLTHWLIDRFGWRHAFAWLAAVVVAAVVPPVALLMERSPLSAGAAGGRLTEAERAAFDAEVRRAVTPAAAMRSPNFRRLVVALALSGAGLAVVLLHQITFLSDRGLGERAASWALGATAGLGVVGKLGFGYLLDRYDQRRVAALCFGLQSLGVFLLLATTGPWMLALYIAIYGFAMGGNATLQATLVADCFGRLHYAAISGRLFAFSVGFQALAVPLAGYLRDQTGSYGAVFTAVGLGTLLSVLAVRRLTFVDG